MARRLAIVTHEYHPVLSGGTVFTENLARELSQLGGTVDGIVPPAPDTPVMASVSQAVHEEVDADLERIVRFVDRLEAGR